MKKNKPAQETQDMPGQAPLPVQTGTQAHAEARPTAGALPFGPCPDPELDPQRRLRALLESGAAARRGLARLEQERRRLMHEISGIEAASRQLQEQLPPELRIATHDQYLAAELRRIDRELPVAAQGATPDSPPEPAGAGTDAAPSAAVPGAPGGIERRATPRPAPIRLPDLTMQFPEECAPEPAPRAGLLDRARRALLRGGRDAQQGA